MKVRSSLSSNYLLYAGAIFFTVILLAIGFWVQVYRDEWSSRRAHLPLDAMRIDAVLTDTIDYVARYAEWLGDRIANRPARDLESISDLLGGRLSREQDSNLFVATVFNWVTPDKMLRVSSTRGVLEKPLDVSDRGYLDRTAIFPWKLQISAPRYGSISQTWLIPAGIGVEDKKGNFLGSVTMGFAIDALAKRVAQVLEEEGIRYLILTEDMKLIVDSAGDSSSPAPPDLIVPAPQEMARSGAGYFQHPLLYRKVEYSYYKKLGKYPFVILLGYSPSLKNTLFNRIVVSRLLGLGLIGSVAFAMLFLLQRRLIRPVLKLARSAERIRQGQQVKVQPTGISEIDALGDQLQNISELLQNERRIGEELACKSEMLETAHREALAARDAAVRADQTKSEFLANMSHEIRTPMNAVVGLTNILLMKDFAPDRQKQYLQTMQVSAHHLMQLIDDLLDISKLEAGHVILEQIPFQLREVAEEVLQVHALKAEEKKLSLTLHIEPEAEASVLGDPLRLRQVLMNLVGNAIKFTEEGTVSLRIESAGQDVPATAPETPPICFIIEDSGIGIEPEKLPIIFDKFTQADSSVTRRFGGTGLGLSISRTIVELMGGRIEVESTLGRGTRFICRIPLPRVQGDDAAEPPHPSDRYRVLLVEDNPQNILVASALLESFGYAYGVAHHGIEALQQYGSGRYDMILMDVQMPQLDGLEATRRIRALEAEGHGGRIPIIGMTAYAMSGDRERCLAAGMDAYVSKPFGPRELSDVLLQYAAGKTASG